MASHAYSRPAGTSTGSCVRPAVGAINASERCTTRHGSRLCWLPRSEHALDSPIKPSGFQQICADRFEVRGIKSQHFAHERVDAAHLVDRFEYGRELLGSQQVVRKGRIAFEEVGHDLLALDAEYLQKHHSADPGAIAPRGTVKQHGVNVALRQQFEEALPVLAKMHHQFEVCAS